MPRAPRRSPTSAGGQAAVELVLVLPVAVLVALGVIQVGLVVRAQVLVVEAAREAARAAAVGGPATAGPAARATPGLDPDALSIDVAVAGDPPVATATMAYRAATDVPLVGALVGRPVLRAEVAMLVEAGGADGPGP